MLVKDFHKIENQFDFAERIHGKDEYFNSVVLAMLIQIDEVYHFVLQKRCPNITQGHEICFPGGMCDPKDATLESTAIRETYEELGIPPEKIRIIGRLDTIVAPMGTTVDAFIAVADVVLSDLHLSKSEVESIIVIPVADFMDNPPERYSVQIRIHPTCHDHRTGEEIVLLPSEELGLAAIYNEPWGKFRYDVLAYKTPYGVIWGITARLIQDFVLKAQGRIQSSSE